MVVGVPLHEVDETILQLVSLAALLSLLAIVGTVFASRSWFVAQPPPAESGAQRRSSRSPS